MDETSAVQALGTEIGSQDSMDGLVALHDRDVRSALRRVLGRSQEEDDLVQEVFVRLVIRLRQPGQVCVGAWLRGVAHNLAVDEIRRRRPVPVEETRLDGTVACPGDERLAGGELYSHLVEGAKGLPYRQRAALAAVLASDEAPGVAGVAAKLGVSVHAAESLLSRARTGLREHLASASSDAGSMRTSLGAVIAVVTAGIAWVGRHWRAAAMATAVAAGSVGTVVSLPASPPSEAPPSATRHNAHAARPAARAATVTTVTPGSGALVAPTRAVADQETSASPGVASLSPDAAFVDVQLRLPALPDIPTLPCLPVSAGDAGASDLADQLADVGTPPLGQAGLLGISTCTPLFSLPNPTSP